MQQATDHLAHVFVWCLKIVEVPLLTAQAYLQGSYKSSLAAAAPSGHALIVHFWAHVLCCAMGHGTHKQNNKKMHF